MLITYTSDNANLRWWVTSIFGWVRRNYVWSPSANAKTTVPSGATWLVSNGNNISSRALLTMKARQIWKRQTTSASTSMLFSAFVLRVWWWNLVARYSTDNRNIYEQYRPSGAKMCYDFVRGHYLFRVANSFSRAFFQFPSNRETKMAARRTQRSASTISRKNRGLWTV